jgi:HAD superfamily hydrolase (TIGR01509 family)
MAASGDGQRGDPLKRFDAVICDMDGLLLDTERIALETFVAACEAFGLGDERSVFYRCIGTNQARGREVLEEGLGGKVDYLGFSDVWQVYYAEATGQSPVPLKPGAESFLTEVSSRGLPVAVATSTRTAEALVKLASAGIRRHFSAVIGGDQVERSKPHPDIYLRAADVLGVEPGRCLALEDSDNGVRSAVSAGMTVVQIPDLVVPSPDLLSLGHVVLDSLAEVRHILFVPIDS